MRSSAEATAAKVTPELVMQLRRPLEALVSPDGGKLAYVLSPTFREKNQPIRTRLCVDSSEIDLQGGSLLPRWAPDSRRLAFASDGGHRGRMSLWLLDGGTHELAEIPGSVEDIVWSPGGDALLVLAADLGADRAGAQTATKIEEAGAPEADPKVFRPALYWRRLFLVDATSGAVREVSPEAVNVFEVGWAGGKAVAVCTEDPSESAWYDAWVGVIDLEARTVEKVYVPEWQLQCPRISPSGRVAWIEGFASDRAVVTGTVHALAAGPLAPELDVTWIDFADDETLWYAGWRRSGTIFGRLSLNGEAEQLYAGDAVVGARFQPRISASANGSVIAAPFESPDDPPEIAVFEDGSMRRVTSLNDEVGQQLGAALEWRRYTWASFDGLEIEGLLALPRGYSNGALPLVVLVHGGPTSTFSWQFAHLYGFPHLLAQKGYAVLLPNPRGSSGRGQEFSRANLGDLGGGDLRDILAGVDALVADDIADDDRVAISGGSYGGFMASWAVTQTNRFAAAIPYAVVTNWLSFHNTTNIGQFDKLFLQADPYDPRGAYTTRSPVYHAHKCSTPTLIIHGEVDLCTPLPQATELYNALVEAGCRTELVVYPREGHGWTEREHQIDAWRRIEAWLDEHLG
jgi:dipeptidyl aminopeptidase/acylaminoacyl peptidase